MKKLQKNFLWFLAGIIALLVLVGGVYVYPKTTDISEIVNGKCGLVVSSPLLNKKITWPLVIKGTVVPQRQNVECSWQTFEGVSGTAQVYMDDNKQGWKPIGNPTIFGPNFSITFDYTKMNFPANTLFKIVFTEENPAVIRTSLIFELPLAL